MILPFPIWPDLPRGLPPLPGRTARAGLTDLPERSVLATTHSLDSWEGSSRIRRR